MDARRISDDKLVLIKQVVTGCQEEKIACFLSSPEMLQDPRNHCVPILDVVEDEDPTYSFMVMPFLRYVDDPPFERVQDVVQFCDEIFEVFKMSSTMQFES